LPARPGKYTGSPGLSTFAKREEEICAAHISPARSYRPRKTSKGRLAWSRPRTWRRSFRAAPDAGRYREKIKEYEDAGYDYVFVHQVGPDQEAFQLLPERDPGASLIVLS
jgi:hypothetical protein